MTGHDIGCMLGSSFKSLPNFVDRYMEEVRAVLVVVRCLGLDLPRECGNCFILITDVVEIEVRRLGESFTKVVIPGFVEINFKWCIQRWENGHLLGWLPLQVVAVLVKGSLDETLVEILQGVGPVILVRERAVKNRWAPSVTTIVSMT